MGNEELYAAMDKLTREILAIEKLRGKLVDLFVRKNTDYGNDQIVEFGEFGILVRSTDKLNRLKNLVGKDERLVSDETLDDTWEDLAIYAFIALLLRKGYFNDVRS